MRIAITGHRPNKLGNDYNLTSPLIVRIKESIILNVLKLASDRGLLKEDLTFITGMALGIDTLFAQIAIQYKIPFIAAIPCITQYAKWPPISKERYMEIISHPLCDRYYVSEQPYNNTCMQLRNEWIVNNCDILIGVWDGTSGGTANCIKYAKSKGFTEENGKLIVINPNQHKIN